MTMRMQASLLCITVVAGCGPAEAPDPSIAGADTRRGEAALQAFDCGACHTIPGIRGALGRVGPPLDHYAHRTYVAGKFPNDAQHLVRWIMDPPAMAPRTAMPRLGVTEAEARDIAAFLYTLR